MRRIAEWVRRWAVLAWVVAVLLWHSRELLAEEQFEQTAG